MASRALKRLPALTLALAALSLLLPASVAFGQQPAGVTTVIENRLEMSNPPAPAEVVQLVLDFAPGAWTPMHMHPSPAFVTVLQGEMTLRVAGMDQKFATGQTWVDAADEVHAVGNDTTAPGRILATFVIPKGGTVTTLVDTGAQAVAPPGPTTVAQSRVDSPALPAQYDIIHRLIEIAPGATAPMHTHPGPNFAILVEGSLTLNMEGMAPMSFRAGDTWMEPANVVHGGTATSSTTVRLLASALVPRGAPFSVAAQPAPAAAQPAPAAQPARPAAPAAAAPAQVPRQLPRTGEIPFPLLPATLAGLALAAGGALARRRGR
jgi:quercetin dioxygenase-like cupin family protein